MKAAIYARVSTQEQTTEQQIRPAIAYCEHEGWGYDVFEEHISGAKQNRTQLGLMMDGIRRGEYKAVVVWKLDRLGRSTLHLLQLLEEFRNKGVAFVVTTMGISTDTPEGRVFLRIIAAFAELEREFIMQRVAASIATKKAKGIPMGRPKGSKDKRPRRKSGYIQRYANMPRKGQSWYQKEKELHEKEAKRSDPGGPEDSPA